MDAFFLMSAFLLYLDAIVSVIPWSLLAELPSSLSKAAHRCRRRHVRVGKAKSTALTAMLTLAWLMFLACLVTGFVHGNFMLFFTLDMRLLVIFLWCLEWIILWTWLNEPTSNHRYGQSSATNLKFERTYHRCSCGWALAYVTYSILLWCRPFVKV